MYISSIYFLLGLFKIAHDCQGYKFNNMKTFPKVINSKKITNPYGKKYYEEL